MRFYKKSLVFTGIIVIILFLCCRSGSNYPLINTGREPQVNDYISQNGKITLGKKQYDVELGTIYVPENRQDSLPRLIKIPVKIIKSPARSAIPIFYLSGGPGLSNLKFSPPGWLLENYDMVFVGYRGVDGSVKLDMSEFSQAFSKIKNPLSKKSLKILAQAFDSGLARMKNEKIDITAYTLMDVIDDLEAVRKVLGYEAINLLSQSYGTRLAYLYGLKYPTRVNRSIMVSVNPPGCFVWEPALVEKQLEYYSGLWCKDPAALKKSEDILVTMKEVLGSLPKDWFFIHIHPDKIKLMSFFCLYHRGDTMPNAAQMFDAFIAAKNGDYSGLALMSFFCDMMLPRSMVWGDSFLKAASADFDPARDYLSEMDPPGSILGSPFSQLSWGSAQMIKTPFQVIPEVYRTPQESDVPTLMISGSVDFSTPAENAVQFLPYFKKGRQVILSEFGHTSDLWNLQPEALKHLMLTFYKAGIVDDSLFRYAPMNFTPKTSFQSIAYTGIGVLAGGITLLIAGIAIALYFIFKRRFLFFHLF